MPARRVGDRLIELIESALNDAALGDEYWYEIAPQTGTSPAGVVLAYRVVLGVRGPALNSAPILATFKQPIMAHQVMNPGGEQLIRTSVQQAIPALRAQFEKAKQQLLNPPQAAKLPNQGQPGGPRPQSPN